MRFSRSISLFPFTLPFPRLHLLIYFFAPTSVPLHVLHGADNSRAGVLILTDLTMLPSRKKTKTQSWKPLQKYFTYQQVYNDTANKPDYVFTNYRQLRLFTNYSTAGFKAMHRGGVTLVVSMCWLLVCCCTITKPIKWAN